MATIKRMTNGKWQAQVHRKNLAGEVIRRSKSFATKFDASDWAKAQEIEIANASSQKLNVTLKELLDKFGRDVSSHRKGARWEKLRLQKLSRNAFTEKPVYDVTTEDFARWRDAELARGLKTESVRRELNLFSSVFTIARKEWGFNDLQSPISNLRKPPKGKPRFRRITDDELERLAYVTGFVEGQIADTGAKRVFLAALFAIETAMRAGEITRLRKQDIDPHHRVASLYDTKNADDRSVPLSSRALELLAMLPEQDPLFGFKGDGISSLFRKYREKAGIDDLTFHDTRHEAITRLAKKLHVLDLARMTGHRDLKKLMIYYNESAADIAKLLD